MAPLTPKERLEPLLHSAVPAMIVLFLLTLFGVAAQVAMQSYDKVVPDALTEMEMVGRLAAEDLNAAARRAAPGAPAALILESALARFQTRGRILAVTDPDGQIIAALPPGAIARGLARQSSRAVAAAHRLRRKGRADAHRPAERNRSARHRAQSRRALRPARDHPADRQRAVRMARRRLALRHPAAADLLGHGASSPSPISPRPAAPSTPNPTAPASATASTPRSIAAAAACGTGTSPPAASIGRIPCTTCSP